jgi:SAM-dependent methyltransferase
MSNHTPLVDRAQLMRARARAERMGGDFFLHQEAYLEIQDRLKMVNKPFKSPAIVTSFPALWQAWFPDATVVSDTDVLALKERKHDLVIHAMSLHWANDPVGQLIQCNRALAPDGLMIAAFFGDQTLHELRSCLSQAEIEHSNGLSARVLPMGELRDLGGLLQRASFALPVADKTRTKVTFSSLKQLIVDLRAMGETSALHARPRKNASRDLFEKTEALYQKHFCEDGRLHATFDMIFLTGWAPDASQPKPLMPGSAKARLADALGAKEFNLPNDTKQT